MSTMNSEQLKTFISETTVPLIKDVLGKDLAEVVRMNVERVFAEMIAKEKAAAGGSWQSRLFGRDEGAKKAEAGTGFARCLRAVAAAKMAGGGPDKAIEILRAWGSGDIADAWAENRTKALGSGDPTQGGFLVPTQVSSDVIELLRPAAVVRSLGPMILPMPNGKLEIPKITSGATASYIGENANIGKDEERFGMIRMAFRKLAVLVPISNDLIRYASPGADQIVRDDTVRALATREDKAFIRDNGTTATPKGLKFWMNNANKFTANATVNLDNVTADLGRCLQLIMAADIPLVIQQNQTDTGAVVTVRPGWIFSPRTYRFLTTVRLTQGPYAFRDEMLRGTLFGYPFRVTSQVLETMTAGGADTGGTQAEVYFGCFAHAIIGESLGLTVDASQEAAYHDGTNVVAAFSQDQTVIRVMAEHDFALRHDKAFTLIQSVTWGA